MSHVRKQIRDWLKANLVGSDKAEGRVYVRRMLPIMKTAEAALLIVVQNETSSEIDTDKTQQRVVRVIVTAAVKDDSEDGENTLDELCVFVEKALAADPTMNTLIEEYEYTGTEFAFAGEGEQIYCTAAMNFDMLLHTGRTDPETAI